MRVRAGHLLAFSRVVSEDSAERLYIEQVFVLRLFSTCSPTRSKSGVVNKSFRFKRIVECILNPFVVFTMHRMHNRILS